MFASSGAEPPERDLGLVDDEAAGRRRVQARCRARHAVDVDRQTATAADEVVMVVARARLVAGRAAGERDPPRQPTPVQRLADVIGRLGGDASARRAHAFDHLIDARVVIRLGQHAQHRDARSRHAQSGAAQPLLDLVQQHYTSP